MQLKVLCHDNCFDGAASAAVFSRFYRERINPKAELAYEGLAHQAGAKPVDESVFTGDENAIVDFRYSQRPKLPQIPRSEQEKLHQIHRCDCSGEIWVRSHPPRGADRVGRNHRWSAIREPAIRG